MNLDRFSQGLPDPQDVKPLAYCIVCGGELYEGETILQVEHGLLCDNTDCLEQYAGAEFKVLGE